MRYSDSGCLSSTNPRLNYGAFDWAEDDVGRREKKIGELFSLQEPTVGKYR
jgi:hypothetical protein